MQSYKNLNGILQKIVQGTAPEKFTVEHLKSIGFASSSDRAIIPLLKDLGFLTADGTPTQRYLDYRDSSRSRLIMAEALREAYAEVFHVSEKPTDSDRSAIEGKFKSSLNSSDRVAEYQAGTFLALLKVADLATPTIQKERQATPHVEDVTTQQLYKEREKVPVELRYNIEIHLPSSKDPEVFNAIFKALKGHLLG